MNKRIQITGNVQGVFFRKNAQHKAHELGVRGWVRNEPDGSVLVEIEGESQAIAAMREWLKQGPPRAKVEGIWEEDGEVQGYSGFLIIQ